MPDRDPQPPNVLYVTHRVPFPPNRGDRIRSWHTLQHLRPDVRFHLACMSDEPVTQETRAQLDSICERWAVIPHGGWRRWARGVWSLASGRSATEGIFYSPAMRQMLQKWHRELPFDVAIAFSSSMAQYLLRPEFTKIPVIVDLVDVDSRKWFDYARMKFPPAAWLYDLEATRLLNFERQIADRAEACVLVSPSEVELFRSLVPNEKTIVVSNGVDLKYFQPANNGCNHAAALTCVFVGVLDYFPNVDGVTWFCQHVWPEIRQRFPDAKFQIVGQRPHQAIRRMSHRAGVELVGPVDDVRPYLQNADLVVAPLRIARGIQNKVLEAMASGKAVVASPAALKAFPVVQGLPCRSAMTTSQWVKAIGELFDDAEQRIKLGQAARQFAEQYHDWSHCVAPLLQLIQRQT